MGYLIGIVTVLFNSDSVLPGFFESLSKQEGVRYKLYVIDNSLNDSGAQLCRKLSGQFGINLRLVCNDANLGVAKGNNQGIELARTDNCNFILLANNDTEFGPTTIRQLQDVITRDHERVATPKIMYYQPSDRIWYAGGRFRPWLGKTQHYGVGERDHGQYDAQRHVGYAPTCFIMLDAKVFDDVGIMDERYFVYYDDADFVWRMTKRGIAIRFVPDACVLHKVSSSTGGDRSKFSLYYNNRNRIYFIRKNLGNFQRMVALSYTMCTRLPRICQLPPSLAKIGWRGVIDGFGLAGRDK